MTLGYVELVIGLLIFTKPLVPTSQMFYSNICESSAGPNTSSAVITSGLGELPCQIALQMMTRNWKHAVHEIQQAASDGGSDSKFQVISYHSCL
jgi:hypothetical protein